jgi:uncharacterized protein (DUF952 family)
MKIYHLIEEKSWLEQHMQKSYRSESLTKEGFIHCCFGSQILEIANQFYLNKGVIVLELQTEALDSKLIIEKASNSEIEFPHIYGEINKEAVSLVFKLQVQVNGQFELPENLSI